MSAIHFGMIPSPVEEVGKYLWAISYLEILVSAISSEWKKVDNGPEKWSVKLKTSCQWRTTGIDAWTHFIFIIQCKYTRVFVP